MVGLREVCELSREVQLSDTASLSWSEKGGARVGRMPTPQELSESFNRQTVFSPTGRRILIL